MADAERHARGARDEPPSEIAAERRAALLLCAPALVAIAAVALFPLGYTFWESLHLHDLRMPWRGRPFIGLANYAEALADARFWQALAHTAGFTAVSVGLELGLGLALALLLHGSFAGRGIARTIALLPWAMPTVVVALVFRFLFEPAGPADALLLGLGVTGEPPAWLGDASLSWLPIVLADVWKTTPFVALLLLAGLQNIDPSLYEAARIDGARPLGLFVHVTLPGLWPALIVALLFRAVDALRVFDLIYVLTGGGPGTATEPLAMYSFTAFLRNLRFGYGSALAVIVFAITLLLSLVYIRVAGRPLFEERR
jgi:ABC-type sugar transport system permease subunit